MTPWRERNEDPREAEAAKLLERAAKLPTWTDAGKKKVWKRIETSAQEPPRAIRIPLQLGLALAGGFAVLAFAWVRSQPIAADHTGGPVAAADRTAAVANPTRAGAQASAALATPPPAIDSDWLTVDLGPIGKLRVHPSTVYRVPPLPPAQPRDAFRIGLDSGELCAEIAHRDPQTQGPLIVEAPHVQIFVVGTRFCVDVNGGETRVSVADGRVRVQGEGGEAFLGGGETIVSSDARLKAGPAAAPRIAASGSSHATARPPVPSTSPPVAPASGIVPPAAPGPSSLAEQNALYSRGVRARDGHDGTGALAAWGQYLQRFPKGVLAPEASAGVLSELVAEGRATDALAAADAYLHQFPGDGRAAEVDFIRGNLLREKLGRTAEALAAYRAALALAAEPALRDDALFAVGACQKKLGQTSEARETFTRYRAEFPHGAHAAEIDRWLP